jgi:nucleoside-diphosphate-sugar epimerase
MKIIITGALGHIGSSLIRYLPSQFGPNLSLWLIDDLSTQRFPSLFNLPKTVRYYFIENKVQECDFDQYLIDADVVVHFAATTDAAGTANNPDLVHGNNFNATKHIGEACLKNNVPLIFPSSTSVYGSQSSRVDEDCLEEDLRPQSPYAHCKINEEKLIQSLGNKGLKYTIFRLGTIYGVSPGMRFHTAVNKFCWQAVMGQPLEVWETAMDQKRPYLSLQDACKAITYAIDKKLYNSQRLNLVTGNHTVRDVIENIKKFIPSLRINKVSSPIMNQLSYEVSNEKIKALGFKFSGDLKQGIQDTLENLRAVINYQY